MSSGRPRIQYRSYRFNDHTIIMQSLTYTCKSCGLEYVEVPHIFLNLRWYNVWRNQPDLSKRSIMRPRAIVGKTMVDNDLYLRSIFQSLFLTIALGYVLHENAPTLFFPPVCAVDMRII